MNDTAPVPLILNLPHQAKIVVPPWLGCMTTYVLLEQEDWFEDELRFLRQAMRPGMRMIDIGANLGVYSLSLAPIVGANGHIWAIEPAHMTARFLEHSIGLNQFGQIDLIVAGISDQDGTGFLHHDQNPEMHSLVAGEGRTGPGEQVSLVTLDSLMTQLGHPVIDVLKIDAEDHEQAIFAGGTAFLNQQSPLLMLEVIGQGKSLNTGLVAAIQSFGFEIYRLVPGLNLLVRTDTAEIEEMLPLNVFCLKPEARTQWQHILAADPVQPDPAMLDVAGDDLLTRYW